MATVTRLADRFTLPQYEVVLDDGFSWKGGVANDIPLDEVEMVLVPMAEQLRDLRKQSGRWNSDAKEEGTNSSGNQRAA